MLKICRVGILLYFHILLGLFNKTSDLIFIGDKYKGKNRNPMIPSIGSSYQRNVSNSKCG